MSEFSGKAGTIYVEKSKYVADGESRWEVWFEDFCILGAGNTELEALLDAQRMTLEMGELVGHAIAETRETATVSSAGAGD